MQNYKSLTLADIARKAGVSPGTVSRALSGTDLVNDKTKAKIMAIADAMNYKPNIAARNLRTKKTGAIGVIIPLGHEKEQNLSDPFFSIMLGCIADELTQRNHDLLLTRVSPKDENWLEDYINSGRADGVIVIGQSDQSEVINRAAKHYRPMVVWGANLSDQTVCTVGSDNRFGGLISAVHLVERGCKKLAFFGDTRLPEIQQRMEGCIAGAKASGLAEPVEILETHLTAEAAYQSIKSYISENNIPDGVFAASDVIAMSAIRAFREAGIAIPEKVKIVGYDDLELASYTSPPLSTVRQDLKFAANKLVEVLFRRISGEETQSIVITPELQTRDSTRIV